MRVSVHIPDSVGAEARRYAEKEGLSISQFYARAVEAELARRKRREAHDRISELAGTVDPDEYSRRAFENAQREFRHDDPDR
jgi:hypothetical protein